jgi:hypothetical protein
VDGGAGNGGPPLEAVGARALRSAGGMGTRRRGRAPGRKVAGVRSGARTEGAAQSTVVEVAAGHEQQQRHEGTVTDTISTAKVGFTAAL